MTTQVEAFRPSYIAEVFADVSHTLATGQVCHPEDVARFCHYAYQARELGFTGVESLWSQIVSYAQTGTVPTAITAATEIVHTDWQQQGLSHEQAWEAMWLV